MYSVPKIPRPFCCSGEKSVSPSSEKTVSPITESKPFMEPTKNPSAALPISALLFFSFLTQQKEG